MTALYIVGGIALLIAAVALTPLRVWLEYSSEGFFMKVRVLFFTIVAVPAPKKGEKKVKVEKTKKKKPEEKRGGLAKSLKGMVPQIPAAVKKLFKGLKVREMKVYYLAATGDAYETAMAFGRASAALGAVTALLESVFRIKNRDYRVDFSFEKSASEIYIEAKLSLRIGKIVSIAWGLFIKPMFKGGEKTEKPSENVKGGKEHGQASSQ